MSAPLVLPERLDRDAARDLHAELMQRRDADLVVDGLAVRATGALAVQVLVAATRDWTAKQKTLAVAASPSMREDLARLGVLNEICLQEVT